MDDFKAELRAELVRHRAAQAAFRRIAERVEAAADLLEPPSLRQLIVASAAAMCEVGDTFGDTIGCLERMLDNLNSE